MKLGVVLKKWRLMVELSLRDAGAMMHLSAPSLMRIEQGRNIDAQTLMIVLNWLMEETPRRGDKLGSKRRF